MKFCYNTNFTLPKQSQRSRSVLQDGSRSLGLLWKEKTPSYKQRNTVSYYLLFEIFSPKTPRFTDDYNLVPYEALIGYTKPIPGIHCAEQDLPYNF